MLQVLFTIYICTTVDAYIQGVGKNTDIRTPYPPYTVGVPCSCIYIGLHSNNSLISHLVPTSVQSLFILNPFFLRKGLVFSDKKFSAKNLLFFSFSITVCIIPIGIQIDRTVLAQDCTRIELYQFFISYILTRTVLVVNGKDYFISSYGRMALCQEHEGDQ